MFDGHQNLPTGVFDYDEFNGATYKTVISSINAEFFKNSARSLKFDTVRFSTMLNSNLALRKLIEKVISPNLMTNLSLYKLLLRETCHFAFASS